MDIGPYHSISLSPLYVSPDCIHFYPVEGTGDPPMDDIEPCPHVCVRCLMCPDCCDCWKTLEPWAPPRAMEGR